MTDEERVALLVAYLESEGANLSSVQETGWRKIRCPFTDAHANEDRTPSAVVNLELGGFTCFACGASGDAIKLIREREGLDFAGAVEFARDRLGIDHVGRRGGAVREHEPWRPSWL